MYIVFPLISCLHGEISRHLENWLVPLGEREWTDFTNCYAHVQVMRQPWQNCGPQGLDAMFCIGKNYVLVTGCLMSCIWQNAWWNQFISPIGLKARANFSDLAFSFLTLQGEVLLPISSMSCVNCSCISLAPEYLWDHIAIVILNVSLECCKAHTPIWACDRVACVHCMNLISVSIIAVACWIILMAGRQE